MKVLVTGGAGFIGSNLVFALAGSHEVGVIDDLSSGSIANLYPGAWFRKMDILDSGLADAVGEFAPDAVVHLAAQSSVTESLRDPERDRAVNLDGTRAVAAAAASAGASRVLSASSAAVYGEPSEVPLRETATKEPTNPYGHSKLAAEQALADVLTPEHTDYASLRFANVYGPRQNSQGEGGVVAVFCDRLADGETPIIHGDGRQTRDFIYVGDVVSAVLEALLTDASLSGGGGPGAAYNISTGSETSVEQLALMLRGVTGFHGAFEYTPAREGDVDRSALDAEKARSVFGWEARVPLETGLTMTYRWFVGQHGESSG